MSISTGMIDPKLSGNLVKKFGESLPIPFINNVFVTDEGIEVVLSMYFKVTQKQLENKEFFVDSVRQSGINTYFMLLVEETAPEIANNPRNYNYKKFLENVDKINKADSHILNYIQTGFLASTETIRETTPEGYPLAYFDIWSPPKPPRSLFVAFPQPPEDLSLIFSSGESGFGSDSAASYFKTVNDLKTKMHTNTYEVPMNSYKMSGVTFSKDEEPVIIMSARHKLSYSGLKPTTPGNLIVVQRNPEPIEDMSDIYHECKFHRHQTRRDAFFGHNSPLSVGVKRCGIVSFSSLISELDRNYDPRSGVQAIFRNRQSLSNFYKSFVSDISHTMIMEDGRVLVSPITIYEDINNNIVEKSEVLQSINSQYHAQDSIKSADIIEGLTELITTSTSNEINQHTDSLSMILSDFGNTEELLPQLNKFRSQIPDRSSGTLEGKFYEKLKKKIYDANQLVLQGRKLKKYINNNPLVSDLRDPMFYYGAYRAREDRLVTARFVGHDGSYTTGGSMGPSAHLFAPDAKMDFIPFIYTKGHDCHGQVGLDPKYNPLAVPSAYKLPPYFANDSLSVSATGLQGYANIRQLINKLYTYHNTYMEAMTVDGGIDLGSTPGQQFKTFMTDRLGVDSDIAEEVANFSRYLLQQFSYNSDISPGTPDDVDLELKYILSNLTGDEYDADSFNLDVGEAPGSEPQNSLANNQFTMIENGHYSFDYEKAIGLMSNISLAFNTSKLDSFFGRSLLQSHYRVVRTRVDIHAKLISQEIGTTGEHFVDMEQYPRDKSGNYAAHLPIGRIEATCNGQLTPDTCDPVITICNVNVAPWVASGMTQYQAAINSFLAHPYAPAPLTTPLYELGTAVDYSIYGSAIRTYVDTGYELGPSPSYTGLLRYSSMWAAIRAGGYGPDGLQRLIEDSTALTPYGTDTNPLDTVSPISDVGVVESMGESLTDIESVESESKAHSYIALRNIGGIYNDYTPGFRNFNMKQWVKLAGPPILVPPDGALASVITNPVTTKMGDSIVNAWAAGAITSADAEELQNYYWLNNQFSYMPGIFANVATEKYRLMTFEFQKVGIIHEKIMAETDLGTSFANVLAFRAGIFPEQLAKYVNRQFYEFYVGVQDTTLDVYKYIRDMLAEQIKQFAVYTKDCGDNCVFNDLTDVFNTFFVDGIEAAYAGRPADTPWIAAPLLYCFHVDLLTNRFNGDKDKIIEAAQSISAQVSPRTGSLRAIEAFNKTITKFYSDTYSSSAATIPGTPAYMIRNYAGPVDIHFGREKTEWPDKAGLMSMGPLETHTSAYTMMIPYAYNGYVTNFAYDLQDTFSYFSTGGYTDTVYTSMSAGADGYSAGRDMSHTEDGSLEAEAMSYMVTSE